MNREEFDRLQELAKKAGPLPGPLTAPAVEEPTPTLQIGFDVVEVQRVGLQPGDVLAVTVKNNDVSQEAIDQLRKQLQIVFPDNKVFVFAMGVQDDVHFAIISQTPAESCSTSPVGYCGDCDCGKKETALAKEGEPA
jgi:hypothetical protein